MQVVLEESQRWRLERTARPVSEQARAIQRSKIILLAGGGLDNPRVATLAGVSVNTVRKWRERFGPELEDAHRPGRQKLYGAKVRVQIVAAATSAPPYPESSWSHRRIPGAMAAYRG